MAETTTINFNWRMPDPGGSANTWGATLNATTQAIDAQVFANQQAASAGQAPIGAVTMFAGATAPTGWLICNGASLATTGTYAALFAIVGYAFGGSGANFNLPNFVNRFPQGAAAGGGGVGGASTVTLATANLPAHAHPITDVAHTHSASQPAHNHPDQGHTHGVNDPQHFHTTVNTALGSGSNIQPGSGWNLNGATTTDYKATGVSIQTGYANPVAAQPAITVTGSGTGLSTTQSVGSGTPIPTVPPWLAISFIIRYK